MSLSKYRYRYVRQRRGGRWQARIWLNAHDGFLNLGTYPSALEAWGAVRRYLNQGILPEGLLPRWVRTRRKYQRKSVRAVVAVKYYAITKREGRVIRTGDFDTPEAAQNELRRLMDLAFGKDWILRPLHPTWQERKARLTAV